MISINDIYWTASFLEGEGCFQSRAHCPSVSATQVEKEPLEALKSLFGGTIYFVKFSHTGLRKDNYVWRLGASAATALMMTLYPLMKSRRQSQIRAALKDWRTIPPHSPYRKTCFKGHPYTPENTMVTKDSWRICKTCHRINAKLNLDKWKRIRAITNPPKGRIKKQQCPHGHPYTPENTYLNKKGAKTCRTCKKIYQRGIKRNHGSHQRGLYRNPNQLSFVGIG